MAKQQSPEEQSANTSGQAGSQPAGNEVHATSGTTRKRPARQSSTEGAGEAASQRRNVAEIEQLQQTATQYFKRLTDSAGELTTQARRVYDDSQGFVRSHPAQSLGGAFVAGVILGLLMGRE